jgi:hypothetical protein
MSTDGGVFVIQQKAKNDLRELLQSYPELLNRFDAEYKEADMIRDNSDNLEKIIENFKKEYEKEEKKYKSLFDRLGGKKRRQKKTKKSRKQRKTRKLRKTRARK